MAIGKNKRSLWSRVLCALLLSMTRVAWGVPVILAAVFLAGTAQAAPSGVCPKVMSHSPQGVAVRIDEGCDLFRVVRAYPLINPETGQPFPTQIQLRSIYAANQDHYEDGVFVRRTVMRNCARPGKPDPYADKDELESVCKNGDGLAYYFGIPGVRIFIPSKRQYTQAESAELAQQQLDAELAAQAAAASKKKSEKEAELRVQVNEEAKARIADLESRLETAQAQVASLRTPAARGRWFWGLLIAVLALAIYGVGSTTVAVRAKRIKPVIASGRFYPDVEVASEILSDENEELKRNYAVALNDLKEARKAVEASQARITQLEADVAAQGTLALTRLNEREDAKSECAALRGQIARLNEEGDDLNRKYLRLEVELKDRQRPSFRPPGLESDLELRGKVQGLREEVVALQGVRARQAQQLQQVTAEKEALLRRVGSLERIKAAVEFERDQAVEASRAAQARVAAKLQLVRPLADLVSDDASDAPTKIKDNPLVLVADNISTETSEGLRHSVPPPPLSSETTSRQAVLQEMSTLLDEAWNLKRDRSEAKTVMDNLSLAIVDLREKVEAARDSSEVVALMTRIEDLEKKIEVWRQTWESLCQKEQEMERLVHELGFQEFALRRHSWQTDEASAEHSAALSAYKIAAESLVKIVQPEDQFAALQQEMSDVRKERNQYRDALHELATVAYAEEDAANVKAMPPEDKVRHVVGTLTDICRQWLLAAKQATQSVVESGPPASPQTTSDIVRSGTLASRQDLGALDLQAFQAALAKAPSYLVADAVKSCIREWWFRIMREGERVYNVYTADELYELNAFLCSPLIGGSGMDLTTTIGKALEGHKVQHASDSSCRHPSQKGSTRPALFQQTVRPGDGKFGLGDVAAGLNRNG